MRSVVPSCIQYSLATLLCYCLLGSWALGEPGTAVASRIPYRLHFFNTHTGERLDIEYRHGSTYDREALTRIDYCLRDYRTGKVHNYDPQVLDLLHDLTVALRRPDAEIEIICGYRTPWSNEYLRTHGHGVASHSLHMQAKAIDIRISGVSAARLRDAALALNRGGVGYYSASGFVHVDIGRVRRW